MIWHSPYGGNIYETFRFSLLYDQAKFLAYLTIIPTAVLFLVYVETEFYDKFKKYFQAVRKKCTLGEIATEKGQLVQLVYRHIVYLLERQVVISITVIVLTDQIFIGLGLSPALKDMFRITVLGALCNAMLLVVILLLLYFEARLEAFAAAVIFFAVNLIATFWFLPLGVTYFGVPLLIAALSAFILALQLLNLYLRNLTYHAFSKQQFFLTADRGPMPRLADWLNAWQLRHAAKSHNGNGHGTCWAAIICHGVALFCSSYYLSA